MSIVSNIQNFATRVATEMKSLRTLINGNQSDLSALTTTAKGNIVLALNEIKAQVSAITPGAAINDSASAANTTYSSNKITALVNAAITAVTNGAPAALDTLKELSDALNGDANFAGTVTAALATRLRFDAAQTLTAAQQLQGQSNLNVYSKTDIGDPATDFVATFTAGLA